MEPSIEPSIMPEDDKNDQEEAITVILTILIVTITLFLLVIICFLYILRVQMNHMDKKISENVKSIDAVQINREIISSNDNNHNVMNGNNDTDDIINDKETSQRGFCVWKSIRKISSNDRRSRT